jgi:RNA polymerase sigma factor (sigma-70 family)
MRELGIRFKETRSDSDFRALHDRLLPGLRTQAAKMARDQQEIDELVQLTMIQVHQRIGTYQPTYSPSTWAHRILYVELLKLRRKASQGVQLTAMVDAMAAAMARAKRALRFRMEHDPTRDPLDPFALIQPPEEPVAEEHPMTDRALALLEAMPEAQRRLVRERYFDGVVDRKAQVGLHAAVRSIRDQLVQRPPKGTGPILKEARLFGPNGVLATAPIGSRNRKTAVKLARQSFGPFDGRAYGSAMKGGGYRLRITGSDRWIEIR